MGLVQAGASGDGIELREICRNGFCFLVIEMVRGNKKLLE